MTVDQLIGQLQEVVLLREGNGDLPVLVGAPSFQWHVPVSVKPDEDRVILNCEPL